MEIAALVISIVAALTAVGSLWYSRSAVRTAQRALQLEHGVRLVAEIHRSASMSTASITRRRGPIAAGNPNTTGGGPVLHLRNVGRGAALQVSVTVLGKPRKVRGAMLAPGTFASLGPVATPFPHVHVSWVTAEGRKESARLDPIDVR